MPRPTTRSTTRRPRCSRRGAGAAATSLVLYGPLHPLSELSVGGQQRAERLPAAAAVPRTARRHARAQAAGQYAQLSELLSGAAETLEAQPTAAETLLTYRVGAGAAAQGGRERQRRQRDAFRDRGRTALPAALRRHGLRGGGAARIGAGGAALRALSAGGRGDLRRAQNAQQRPDAACRGVRELYDHRPSDAFAARDGAAEVYKYGAAPSYVKRGARVRRITGSCLPAGLQSADTRPETTGFTLEKGSFSSCSATVWPT